MPRLRLLAFFGLVCAHGALFVFTPLLFESVAPVLAGTVYVPLWGLNAIGLPVFGRAESGGWPAPNLLGWSFVAAIWSAFWWTLVAAFAKVRARPSMRDEP